MTTRLRLAALAVALAACGKKTHVTPGLLLAEPSAVAAFRGITTKSADLRPYLAIANSGSNDLTILDGVDDKLVPAPVQLRSLVYPVPGRPALLASADLGDGKADLLLAVSAGDSRLQVIRTWTADGAIDAAVDLDGDVLALAAFPFDPDAPGTVRVAAALSGERVGIVTFRRSGDAIVADPVDAGHVIALGFRPLALAATPDDPGIAGLQTRVWAATRDDLGGIHGVAAIDVGADGVPSLGQVLDARAPTRLVAAARLAERAATPGVPTPSDATAFTGRPRLERVYAVLDETGCGLRAEIACGLVALDPSGLVSADPAGELPFRAPIAIPGAARALAATEPPAFPPSALEPEFAGTFMRMVTAAGTRTTTAAAGVASTDGHLYFVDLGRFEIPGEQVVNPTATPVAAVDPEATASGIRVTAGYTPTAHWTATWQGALPGLASRRAESGSDGSPWVALQVKSGADFFEVANVIDPVLGIQPDDVVVVQDPLGVGSCASFDATVVALLPSTGDHPGGAMRVGTVGGHPEWDACVSGLGAGKTGLRATVRGGGWVLVRGTGLDAVLAGRPVSETEFLLQWEPETASCPAEPVTSCDDQLCRMPCQQLLRARLARRIGYVPSLGDPTGPALAFTLVLRPGLTTPTRDFAVAIDTAEGRGPFRTLPPGFAAVEPTGIAVFDRSPYSAGAGVRFFVPYQSNVVLDATPTLQGGSPSALH